MSISNESNQQSSKQLDAVHQQGNSDQFDLRPFTPLGIDVVLYDNSGGALHIPHRMLEWVFKVCANKVQTRVMICLIRNTLGYQRYTCEASQTFIANWTDLLEPNARRALKQLRSLGLIILRHRGTSKDDCGVYEVPVVKAYLEYLANKKAGNGTPQVSEIKLISNPPSPSSNQSENSDQNDLGSQINSISKKESNTRKKENTLSLEKTSELPESISNYFSSISAYKKREKEWKHFLNLKKTYSISVIAKCLDYLVGFGLPGNGERCHSPMAFLASGIDQVIASIKALNALEAKAEASKNAVIETEKKALAERNQQDSEWEAKVVAFEKAFPSKAEQAEYISEFQKKNPLFKTNPDALRCYAISCFTSTSATEVTHV